MERIRRSNENSADEDSPSGITFSGESLKNLLNDLGSGHLEWSTILGAAESIDSEGGNIPTEYKCFSTTWEYSATASSEQFGNMSLGDGQIGFYVSFFYDLKVFSSKDEKKSYNEIDIDKESIDLDIKGGVGFIVTIAESKKSVSEPDDLSDEFRIDIKYQPFVQVNDYIKLPVGFEENVSFGFSRNDINGNLTMTSFQGNFVYYGILTSRHQVTLSDWKHNESVRPFGSPRQTTIKK
jgi:hypothetical protein